MSFVEFRQVSSSFVKFRQVSSSFVNLTGLTKPGFQSLGKTETLSLAPLPTSAPSDAGRRPSVLGMPRAARGCARASHLQPWRPRRPPSRTTTSSDKLCAESDTRRDAAAAPPAELLLQARCQHNRCTHTICVYASIAFKT